MSERPNDGLTLEEALYQGIRAGRMLFTLVGASLEMAFRPLTGIIDMTASQQHNTDQPTSDDDWPDNF